MRYYLPVIITGSILASCSSYEAPDLQPVNEKTFTGDNLTLYYNGEPMPNKSVSLTQKDDKATAKLFAEFDLSQLSAFGLSGSIPAPGVFPGSPVTILDLNMNAAGEYWNFIGSGSDDYCSYNYKGYANNDRMAIFISEAKLKTPAINPAVWKPAPMKQTDGVYTSLPFFINWQYEPIPDVDFDLTPFLEAITTIPVIPVYNNTAYMSISQAVSLLLQTVAFSDDGNLTVSYISSVGGASRIAQTLPNRFMYLPVSESKVNIYINPTALFGMLLMAGSSGMPAEDVKIIGNGIYPSGHVSEVAPGVMESILKSEIAKKLAAATLKVILPRLADGLPFDISIQNAQLNLCLDNLIAMQMVEEIITPLFADNDILKAIEAYIENNAMLKPLLPYLGQAMTLIPEALKRTNTLQIGLALVPAGQ